MKKIFKIVKNIVKWTLMIVGAVTIVGVGYSLSQGRNPIQTVTDSTEGYSKIGEDDQSSKPADSKVYKIGQTASIEGVSYRLEKVEQYSGGEYDEARAGHTYLKCTVSIKNDSDRKVSYNPYDWRMVNSQGQEDDYIILMDVENQLESGDLIKGGTISGIIAFEEPLDSEWFRLNLYDNGLWDEDPIATWGFQFDKKSE